MKTLIAVCVFALSTTAFAGLTWDLNTGLKRGKVKLQKVKNSDWLEDKEAQLELTYDFGENVSYVFEDLEDVIEECGFDQETDVNYEDFRADKGHYVAWNKAVKTYRSGKKKTKAYVAFLMVPVWGPVKGEVERCEVHRGTYAVDAKGRDATDHLSGDLLKYKK